MPFCGKCGAEVPEGTKFCGVCGAEIGGTTQQAAPTGAPVQTDDARDVADNKAMAILAYLGILVLIPMFAAKNSKFARFHAVQGFNLFLLEIAYGIVEGILTTICWAISWALGSIMGTILGLVWLLLMVLVIIGIINAANGTKKELPVIGKLHILDSFMKPSI